jgi:hypothetical protein
MTFLAGGGNAGLSLSLPGATAPTRYVGATVSGAPVSGSFLTGDFVIADNGHCFVCTASGSPGTWADVGSAGAVSSVFTRTGAVVAQNADYAGIMAAFIAGSVAATRYVGGTASGAPASGTYAVGDFVIDQTGKLWICTAAGTPGTWTQAGPVSSVFTRTGAVVATSGDYTAAQITNAADKSSGSQQAFTGEVAAPDFSPSGLTGSVAASRYVGATSSGAPASGAHNVGDWVVAQNGHIFVCTVAGTPGTWVDVSGAAVTTTNGTAALSADVAMGAIANVLVDGPTTGSIGANGQVFQIIASIQLVSSAVAATVTFRLWDGTTTYNEVAQNHSAAVSSIGATLQTIVTLTGAATFKISATSTTGNDGNIKAAAPNNSGANVATRISYVRLA